jgi:hypothetical protein
MAPSLDNNSLLKKGLEKQSGKKTAAISTIDVLIKLRL